MECLFEIEVLCSTQYVKDVRNGAFHPEDEYRYFKTVFKIVKNKNYFEVWCATGFQKFLCSTFVTYDQARLYLSRAMKLAMRGMFLYKRCVVCGDKNYYPELYCSRGCLFSFFQTVFWQIETEIEKIPIHLSFF